MLRISPDAPPQQVHVTTPGKTLQLHTKLRAVIEQTSTGKDEANQYSLQVIPEYDYDFFHLPADHQQEQVEEV